MIDDRFISQTYTITNHPICKYDEHTKYTYIRGLGEFLSYITQSRPQAKFIFKLWSESILKTDISEAWGFTPNFRYLKQGLYIDGTDSYFYDAQISLIFDCFYLSEKAYPDSIEQTYIFLQRKTSKNFTKDTLKYVYDFFLGLNIGDLIPYALRAHRTHDIVFQQKALKRVLVVATMSAGKSTLINALIGNKINKVASTVCTNKIRLVYNKQSDEGAILECAGPRYIYTENHKIAQHDSVRNAGVHFQSILANEHLCIIDTPGVNFNGDHSHGEMTRNAVKANDYDILLFVSNGTQFLTNDEAIFLEYVIKTCKKQIIFCLNQCDRFNSDDDSIHETFNIWKTTLMEKGIDKPNIITISAQWALLLRLEKQKLELTKSEQTELKYLKEDIKDSFYHLERYCSNTIDERNEEGALFHTGILNLESLLRSGLTFSSIKDFIFKAHKSIVGHFSEGFRGKET